MTYKLLNRFRELFDGVVYKHRASTNGDKVALELFEDLLDLNRSVHFEPRVAAGSRVVNMKNLITGKTSRRGDGSFGELLPHQTAAIVDHFRVPRGDIANIEIGVETKILAKAMIKQIDRVMSDLENQSRVFRARSADAICVAVVGINQAAHYLSYEGEREFLTTGRGGYLHPIQECAEAERRIRAHVAPLFDELIVLPYIATNQPPHAFVWANQQTAANQYGAALIRISQEYDRRFQ